jgi:Mg-chelatase subunit ChlI
VARLRERFAPKLASLEERIRRAEQAVERERSQEREASLGAAISIGATVLGSFLGRKRASSATVGRAASVLRGAGRTARQRDDGERAQDTVEALRGRLADLEQEFAGAVAELDARLDPQAEEVEPVVVRPRKADIEVELVALAFAPYWRGASGIREPAWTS